MKNKQKNKNSFLFFFGSYFAANVCEMINNIHRKTKTKKKKIKKIKTKRKKESNKCTQLLSHLQLLPQKSLFNKNEQEKKNKKHRKKIGVFANFILPLK